jgi:hypothetical protein
MNNDPVAPNINAFNVVKNPISGKRYFYIKGLDEDNNPIYKEGVYTIQRLQNGIQSYSDYAFMNGVDFRGPVYRKAGTVPAANNTKYRVVPNPTSGKEYYYVSGKNEENRPIYKKGLFTKQTLQNGMQSWSEYMFMNGADFRGPVYKIDAGGKRKTLNKKHVRKSYKK